MKPFSVLTILLLVVFLLLSSEFYSQNNNAPDYFIKGIDNPEDLIKVNGTDWAIVSSMVSTKQSSGAIFALNTKSESIMLLFRLINEQDNYDGLTHFSPHGIYLTQSSVGNYQLYVINHGSREAIEIFDLIIVDKLPKLKWKRHIDFPKNVWANGLVVDGDGSIYATSMYDPTESDFLQKFDKGNPTGQIWKWHKTKLEWQPLLPTFFSGANGIAISPNGENLYVSEWARRKVHKISLAKKNITASATVGFLPDNIRWSIEGNLLIAGQNGRPVEVFESKGISIKNMYFSIVEMSPETLKFEELIKGGGADFANATVAMEANNLYWVGCVQNNKIAVYKK
ncbi:SMP-30/gluconolactonase/LRE family protein [Muricauda sp. 334s03]|uniref:SMP-30/gluconolactonase/LRE family protein n=1 Tax=Flagellimonas yonaguniensis TaxID=3031325 RepID=A0ABT5XWR8_9FLAO|nr:SMP-30/gluconolactonase/LRE family protein [[Muricauda] yonaguniensis]MDF0715627.1 SMP-30/gluconolactonase/LRE family protein [[Muricauda] yonaguniensis]